MTVVQAVNWHSGKTHISIYAPSNSKYSYLPFRFYVLLKDFLADNVGYFPNVRFITPPPPPKRQIDDGGAEIDTHVSLPLSVFKSPQSYNRKVRYAIVLSLVGSIVLGKNKQIKLCL